VVVLEKNSAIGGLLRFGIPNFKLDKHLIDRRMGQMQAEGVKFLPGVHVGKDISVDQVIEDFDAVVLSGGCEQPRDLLVPGRGLAGVHYAMDFLVQQNRRMAGERIPDEVSLSAYDKRVVVIGGGDTGSDCVGTSVRQGARWVNQFELLPKPPERVTKDLTWPNWPNVLRTSTSHEEGCRRDWAIQTKGFQGRDGRVRRIEAARVHWSHGADGSLAMSEAPDSRFSMKADLVLLAMGFVHPVRDGMLDDLGVALDARGNVAAEMGDYRTSVDKVFAAGDMRRGQSLVVWAIKEGRQCARAVDLFLTGHARLPD